MVYSITFNDVSVRLLEKPSANICGIEGQRTRSTVWLRVGRWAWDRWRLPSLCCTRSFSLPRTGEKCTV